MHAYLITITIYIAFAILGYFYISKHDFKHLSKYQTPILLFTLFLGFIIRCYFAVQNYGFMFDIGCFSAWGQYCNEIGLNNMYSGEFFLDYPPFYLYVLRICDKLKSLLGISYAGVANMFMIKLTPMLMDIISGVVIYLFAKKYTPKMALYLSTLYVFCPMTIYNSAIWGQIDCFYTMFIVLSLCFLAENKTIFAAVCYAIALLTKPQALLYGPVLLFIMIKKQDLKETIKAIICGLGVMYALALPFSNSLNPMWLIKLYLNTMNGYRYFTVNGYNLWAILNKNWLPLENIPGSEYINTVVIALLLCAMAYLFFKTEIKTAIFNMAFCMITVIFTLGTMMHERYIFPSVLIAIFGYVFTKKRYFIILSLSASALGYLNIAMCMSSQYGPFYISPVTQQYVGCLCVVVCFLGVIYFVRQSKNEKPLLYTKYKIEICLFAITILYSLLVFYRLGRSKSPQTFYQSTNYGESFVYTLDNPSFVKEIWTYSGMGDEFYPENSVKTGCDFTVFTVSDKNEWTPVTNIKHENVFKWQKTDLNIYTQHLLIMANSDCSVLNELVLKDANGETITGYISSSTSQSAYSPDYALDESECVPNSLDDYYYSTYFDEIYFARSAYELTKGYTIYETTHPQLGKLIIALAVKLMGMTPFATRFFSAVFSVAMIPMIYLLGYALFDSKKTGLLCAALLSVDFMHFTQGRIATTDSFLTFFVMASFAFMALYRKKLDTRLEKVYLCLSGVFMGLALSVKWNTAFAFVGLAIFYLFICIEYYTRAENKKQAFNKIITTCVFCLFSFVLLPILIYTAININGIYSGGIIDKIKYLFVSQKHMLSYHSNVTQTHPYQSAWYQWPIDIKPMWFAVSYMGDKISTISSMGNPFIWICGLLAVVYCLIYGIKNKKLSHIVIFIAWACSLLPWAFIKRPAFIYHYYICVIFVILALGALFKNITNDFTNRRTKYIYLFVALAFICFICYYPVISGIPVQKTYSDFLNTPLFWAKQ